ncbi:MAG: hypothetical protein A2Y36_13300 [Treponema sp. GWA1_62_8]|nr:MAG: hypothetical protein A2Y36_13300 [Treponema sp. GWA1_62_8]
MESINIIPGPNTATVALLPTPVGTGNGNLVADFVWPAGSAVTSAIFSLKTFPTSGGELVGGAGVVTTIDTVAGSAIITASLAPGTYRLSFDLLYDYDGAGAAAAVVQKSIGEIVEIQSGLNSTKTLSFTTFDMNPAEPSAPANLVIADMGNGSGFLSWDQVPTALGYRLSVNSGAPTELAGFWSTSYNIAALASGDAFSVIAYNRQGDSSAGTLVYNGLSAFSFASPAAAGVISGTNVSISVPTGTALTTLVATFTTPCASVEVGSTIQTSGTTPNDFTNPVTYTVTAWDGTTQDYVVTVVVLPPNLVALENGGTGAIWRSIDYGSSWTSVVPVPALQWTSLAGSADGTKLIASAGASGTPSSIYRSVDGGANWTATSAPSQIYSSLASSADGSILGAAVYDNSNTFLYSSDSGTTWQSTAIPTGAYWGSVSCSSDGTHWVVTNAGQSSVDVTVFTGTYNGSWNWESKVLTGYGGTNYPVTAGGYGYVSLSGDGNTIVATNGNGGSVSVGPILISHDFGLSWNAYDPEGSGTLHYTYSCTSSDGQVIAVDTGIGTAGSGYLYVSTNGGTNWTLALGPTPAVQDLRHISMSADGSKMLAASIGAAPNLWFSQDSGANFTELSGAGMPTGSFSGQVTFTR